MTPEKRHYKSHDNGWLYVLGYRETSEFCKIGITTRSVSDRIREMQTGSPYTIYAYAIFNASRIEDLGILEQKCHELFQNFREQGEWFRIDPSVAEQRIREKYGPKGKVEELPLFIEWRDDKRVEDANRADFLKNEIILDNLLDCNFWQRAKVKDVTEILDRGANLETRTKDGYTPLHFASCNSKGLGAVSLLLDSGADIEARTKNGYTPLHDAVRGKTTDIVSLLLDRGAKLEAHTENKETPLHLVAVDGQELKMVTLLLDRGANLEARNSDGATPLHWATVNSKMPQVVPLLLDSGANLKARTKKGATILHFAAANSQIAQVVEFLLDRGAKLETRAKNGETPLHAAAANSQTPEVVKLLLDRGANAKTKNDDGKTPFDLVEENEHLQKTKAYHLLNEARYR